MVRFYCPYCLAELDYVIWEENCDYWKKGSAGIDFRNNLTEFYDYEFEDGAEENCEEDGIFCPECGHQISEDEIVVIDDDGVLLKQGFADFSDIIEILRRDFDIEVTEESLINDLKKRREKKDNRKSIEPDYTLYSFKKVKDGRLL